MKKTLVKLDDVHYYISQTPKSYAKETDNEMCEYVSTLQILAGVYRSRKGKPSRAINKFDSLAD